MTAAPLPGTTVPEKLEAGEHRRLLWGSWATRMVGLGTQFGGSALLQADLAPPPCAGRQLPPGSRRSDQALTHSSTPATQNLLGHVSEQALTRSSG
jgi:hypothetical protein